MAHDRDADAVERLVVRTEDHAEDRAAALESDIDPNALAGDQPARPIRLGFAICQTRNWNEDAS
jgi:hypothetical protein